MFEFRNNNSRSDMPTLQAELVGPVLPGTPSPNGIPWRSELRYMIIRPSLSAGGRFKNVVAYRSQE
jgi:hypothetical protein